MLTKLHDLSTEAILIGMQIEMLDIPGLRNTSEAFRSALAETALGMGLDPSFLAAVMAIETGRTFSPSIKNPHTGAVGLIQFMPPTAAAMGTSTEELAKLSNIEQLPWVAKFFRPYIGRIRRNVPGDYYLAVFWPALIGKDHSSVIFRSGDPGYAQNAGLDRNQDGLITAGDVVATVDGVVAAARTRPPIRVTVGVSLLVWALGGIVATLVGYAAYDSRREILQALR